jgi:hypothetical protein
MYDIDDFSTKVSTEVELTFLDRTKMRGWFFAARTQRVSDVLNDQRTFVPFTDISGAVRLVNKNNVVDVRPSHQEDGGRQKGISVV